MRDPYVPLIYRAFDLLGGVAAWRDLSGQSRTGVCDLTVECVMRLEKQFAGLEDNGECPGELKRQSADLHED